MDMAKHCLRPHITLGGHIPHPKGTHTHSLTHPPLRFWPCFIDKDH